MNFTSILSFYEVQFSTLSSWWPLVVKLRYFLWLLHVHIVVHIKLIINNSISGFNNCKKKFRAVIIIIVSNTCFKWHDTWCKIIEQIRAIYLFNLFTESFLFFALVLLVLNNISWLIAKKLHVALYKIYKCLHAEKKFICIRVEGSSYILSNVLNSDYCCLWAEFGVWLKKKQFL